MSAAFVNHGEKSPGQFVDPMFVFVADGVLGQQVLSYPDSSGPGPYEICRSLLADSSRRDQPHFGKWPSQ